MMPRTSRHTVLRHCFCNFCKGSRVLSRFKVQRHVRIYGLWKKNDSSKIISDSKIDSSDSEGETDKLKLTDENYKLTDFSVHYEEEGNERESSDITAPGKLLDASFKTSIDEYLEGIEPIPTDQDSDSSNLETSCDSSDSDSDASESPKEECTTLPGPDDVNEQLNTVPDLDEALANSPPLHSSLAVTLLETLVYLFDWFSTHPSLSKKAFSSNLQIWHSILPKGNLLPTSYKEAYKIIKPYIVTEIVFDVCPNDCILFRGEYKDSTTCPKCNSSRFKGHKIPRRTFHYMPLGPRISRNYGTKNISHVLQSHNGEKSSFGNACDRMNDIHDSPKWKEAFSTTGVFEGDPRGLGLSMCLDGLNPWSKNKANYSMWPIVLGQLNLPRKIRFNFANIILVGIIPSQTQGMEPKNLDPYLEVVLDEIMSLSSSSLYDAYKKAPFQLKVAVIIYVLDYQGIGKVFSLTGTGSYRSCAWCMHRGCYCIHLHKVVYPGNRRFLPEDNTLRRDCHDFPEHSEELRDRPEQRNFKQDVIFHKAYDSAKNQAQRTRIATGTGCRSMYILASKNQFFNRVEQTVPDAMHTIAVQVKHLIKCVAGKSPEDGVAVRIQEKTLGRFKDSWPATCSAEMLPEGGSAKDKGKRKNGSKTESSSLPKAPFGLNKKEIEEADKRAKEVVTPAGDYFTSGPIFSRISRLNSFELKEVAARGILKYCVRDFLGQKQRECLILFTDAIAALCAPVHDKASIELLKEKVKVALARLERDFPLSLQVVTNHLLQHIPEGIEQFGPVHGTWMFAYERFNSWLCRRAMNRRHPEATILRTYQIFEWCQYVKMSRKMVNKIPFELPPNPEQECPESLFTTPELHSQGSKHTLSNDHLASMERIYKLVPECQSLLALYNSEKETARKKRKLKKFPKFSEWRPEGSLQSGGLNMQATVFIYNQYSVDELKQHSRNYLYVSKQHTSKRPSTIYILNSFETTVKQNVQFGVIEQIYSHMFAQQTFIWALVSLFKEPLYDATNGLWVSKDLYGHTVPVLLRTLSHPLTIAIDSNSCIWFLDVCL